MATTRPPANSQVKKQRVHEGVGYSTDVRTLNNPLHWMAASNYYRFQETDSEACMTTIPDATRFCKKRPIEINASWEESIAEHGMKTIPRSFTRDKRSIDGEDYHQFYDLIGDAFRTGAHLGANAEQLFNDFCRRLLSSIGPMKWSSLVGLTDVHEPSRMVHRTINSISDAPKKQQITSVIGEKLPEKARIYDLSKLETPAILRMLRGQVCETAVLPVRLDHQNALWILGSDQPGYLDRIGLKHLLMAPSMLELMVTAKEQAQRDPLTGLPNRAYLTPRLAEARARSVRQKNLFALGVLDLDGFKAVNDTLGHKAGDWILQEVSTRWKNVLRASDALIRLGGDEFVILVENLENYDVLAQILDRIKEVTDKPYIYDDHKIQIGVSLGLTIFPFDDASAEALIHHADQALYVAKATKATRRQFFTLYSETYGKSAS
ncbi:Diguanylate cyclase [Acidithiobacillus ferrivorans]|uniref:Diguanylate cyclase n=1 Tax=Acidithiobacillus ferrivorans TaxID=160808 RepID=A0A060UP42_9PROT|nr:GGDEF domain-containing protein [Acidithiobacillus ferrivorans]CDQ10220.1 Diguanylate cyclase [Acidithiobacillus ferrivorans]SMH64246.1 Diguanylate cyclase [Acidithiobacillus ferrivorans]